MKRYLLIPNVVLLAVFSMGITKGQTVYNLVVGGTTNITINSTHSYDSGNWGDDPNSFPSGCGSADHKWCVQRARGFMTTTLPGSGFSYGTNPDNSLNSITVLSSAITAGEYLADDNYYEEQYCAERKRDCVLCKCDITTVNTVDNGRQNSSVTSRYVFNVEKPANFVNKLKFNPGNNTYTVCSGDTAFTFASLVDNGKGNFYNIDDTNIGSAIFNPAAKASKTPGNDTTISYHYFKSYDNGTVSKFFNITVISAGKITTASSNHKYPVCRNQVIPNISTLIVATPGAGAYSYNGNPITSLNPVLYSTNSINVVYAVQIGTCMSYDTSTINFNPVPNFTNKITTLGSFCNNTPNLAINSTSFPSYFSEMWYAGVSKVGRIRGEGVKTKPINSIRKAIIVNNVIVGYQLGADTLQLSQLVEGQYNLYYDLEDVNTLCMNTDTFTVTIKSPTTISFNDSTYICSQQATYKMSNDAIPKGGKFKPLFQSYLLNDSTLNIKNIPLGTIPVTYTYTNKFNCVSTATLEYSVKLKPNITMPPDTAFCEKAMPKQFKPFPSGGQWTGTGITTDGLFDPSLVQTNSYYKLTYAVTIGTCSDTKTMYATIVSNPSVPTIIGAKTNYCTGDSINLYATVPNASGLKYQWYENDATIPFAKSSTLALTADKSLRRYLVESVNAQGCSSSTKAETVFILTEVNIKMTLAKYHIKKGDHVGLNVTVQGDVIKNTTWDFGDGTSGIGPGVVHYYYDTGSVVVKCLIETQLGCEITKYADSILHVKGTTDTITLEANRTFGSSIDNSENYISIYPNPSSDGSFTLYFFHPENGQTIFVTDLLGRMVFQKDVAQLNTMSLDLSSSEFKSGLYLLQFQANDNKKRVYKISKAN